MADKSIERRALEWALGDDTGMSSKAICAFMTGATKVPGMPPSDAADRGRCIRLLKLIPEWIDHLDAMAESETPRSHIVIGASGTRTETNSWKKQIPLILEEGQFHASN